MTGYEMLKLANPLPGTEFGRKIINPEWSATIFPPQHYEGTSITTGEPISMDVPGAQQFDAADRWNKRYTDKGRPPSNLSSKGYRVPNLMGLPEGQYLAGNASNEAWRRAMAGRVMPATLGMPALEGALSLAAKPMPRVGGGMDMLQMSRTLNSWRRNQMKADPAFSRAFRMLQHPSNKGMLSKIVASLMRIK